VTGSILVVDDDVDTTAALQEALQRRGFRVDTAHSADECLIFLKTHSVDVVITDVQMPGMTGLELCQRLHEQYPDLISIVLTGHGNLDSAISAIRAGAFDYITKPVKIDSIAIAIGRALEQLSLRREVKRLRASSDTRTASGGIVGSSPAIRDSIEMVRRIAPSDATVLITGESGTGKELVARSIHAMSPRRDRPFVALNCAAMPAPLLESELFGHVRGAFTDAKQSRHGLFVQAEGGTIFLDEIGEMPIEMQVKLLRVLQERTIRPVGGDTEVAIDTRVVAASNRDLDREVAEKRFREDLFYRINVVAISVPPLRARVGDILVLAQFFLERAANRIHKPVRGISAAAAKLLTSYDWPGNVRELENSMERAVALCRLDEITVDDLPGKLQDQRANKLVIMTDSPTELTTLDEMERRYVRQVVAMVGGNKTRAARILGIDRRSLYRRLEEPYRPPEQPAPQP